MCRFLTNEYNSAKDVPHFCKWGLRLITGGEYISRLVEMPQRKVCLWQTLLEGIISNSVAGSETMERILKRLQDVGIYEDCLNEYIDQFVVNEDREFQREKMSLEFLLENVRVGSPYHIRFARISIDGRPHHFQACIARVDDADGTVGFVCGFRDIESIIQDEREKQQELEEAKKAAEAANKEKSTFLFNMSHDTRTPLNAVIGFTELAGNYMNDTEKLNELRHKTLTASYQLLDILNNVLEMARIENDKVVIEEEISYAKEFYEKWSTMFEGEMERKNLTLHTSYDVKHPYLYIDKTHITEAFMNLLSNAVKYTTQGGDIYVSLRELPGPADDECIIETTIRDNGIGMSAGFLEHIFDRFSRARNSSTNGIQGTGLGMPIVKSLVELMHGTITIDSELGQGTTVFIRIPHRIAESPADTVKKHIEHATQVLKGRHILLAEDIEVNAEIVTMLLTEYGCEVEWAQDGVICVDKLIAAPAGTYDLILMDIQMPNMDGYQAAGRIRKLPDAKKAAIPIIAMIANAFKEDVEKAIAAGMNSYLSKPIDVPKMMETLGSFLK